MLVGGIAGTGWYVWQNDRSQSHTSENRRLGDPSESESLLTTPDNLSLYLEGLPRRPVGDNEPRKPWLNLHTYVGSGCSRGPDIKTSMTQHDTTLSIEVEGYSFDQSADHGPCGAMMSAVANIEIDLHWLTNGSKKDLVIHLDNKENTYIMERAGNQITLAPQTVQNVISHSPGSNQPTSAQSIRLSW